MSDEVELISDGDGLAVIGEASAVERFMVSAGLPSADQVPRLSDSLSAGAAIAQIGSEAAANSGRWVKLTKESAKAVKDFGLMDSGTPGVKHAMLGKPGDIKQWIQIVSTPGSMLMNPAVLAGAAGIMAQLAMKQQMDAIQDYLEAIDEKLDDVLRAQKNEVLARVDGVDLAVKEAMSIRSATGRVSEVVWSKVQHQSGDILETQAYALRQLGDIADKLEQKTKIGDLAEVSRESEAEVEKWLAVLARCVQLHDAIGILELDRVLDASPDELDQYRLGLQTARRDRVTLLSESTEHLLARMNVAVGTANSKVLLHPIRSPAVVDARNGVASDVYEFRGLLGIESGGDPSEARRWREAANERWEAARATGAKGFDGAKRFGNETGGKARSAKAKLSNKIDERKQRRRD